jgi:hypothetical protein
MKHAGSRSLRLAAAAVVAAVSVTGCSWVKDPDSEETPDASASAAPLPSERPTALPTAFNNPEATTFDEVDVKEAAAGDDTLLTMTAGSTIGRTLPSLDVAYTLTTSGGQYTDLLVDREAGRGIVLEAANEAGDGTFVGEDTFTLTRFDLTSGESLDVATAVLPQDPQGDQLPATARIAGVAGDVVVLEARVGETGSPAAIAVDLELDDVLWRQRPAEVLDVTDDVVVVNTGSAAEPGAVEAVELTTGERRWRSLRDTVDASGLGHSDTTVTVVHDLGVGGVTEIVPLDLQTGEAGAPTSTDHSGWTCTPAATDSTVAVCTVDGDDDVVGWDLSAGDRAWSLPSADRFAPLVTLVQEGRVYGLLDNGTGIILDARTGADVATDTGAGPVAVNDWGGVLIYQGKAVFMPTLAAGASASASASESPSEATDSPSDSTSDSPSDSVSESPSESASPESPSDEELASESATSSPLP